MSNENSKLDAERALFQAYLDDCRDHDLEPCTAGAFRFALQAPSLPAAGSAVEEVEVVAYGSSKGIHPVPARCAIGSSGALLESYDTPLMTVAQHNRIVAALSAQQSAPDRVSVPVELLRRVCWPVASGSDRHTHSEAVSELRALLASHGRGDA